LEWFITGAYLVLAGCARFMEEQYRFEPQTVRWLGLPMYRPLAVASALAGALLMTWGGAPAPSPQAFAGVSVIAAALAFGLPSWFAMGVDFPDSLRRFARLSG
jgi:phosphatidylglycerol:prolipoprotein diacylglycerol transferase